MLKEIQSIHIKKSLLTNNYNAQEPMNHSMYLLYTLMTQEIDTYEMSVKSWIDFCKNSSIKCKMTSQLFIHKHHGNIEIYSLYDLTDQQDLCLPENPQLVLTSKNFIQFMIQKNHIYSLQSTDFFIAIDDQEYAHAVTNLDSLKKTSWLQSLYHRITGLTNRKRL